MIIKTENLTKDYETGTQVVNPQAEKPLLTPTVISWNDNWWEWRL